MEFNPTGFMELFESCFCFKRDKRSPSRACIDGDLDYVKRVIANRNDAEKEDSIGNIPIVLSVRSGNVKLVEYLFDIGASRSFATRNKWSLLHEAVSSGSQKMVLYILTECTIPTDLRTDDGVSPIHIAVFNGDVEILNLLLQYTMYGQSSPRGKDGVTPLMIATRHRDEEIMKMLYYSGASFFEKDDYGRNSIVIAKNNRVLEIVHSLNICADMSGPEYMKYPQSKPIMIDTIQSRRNQRKKVFFGIR